MQIPGLTAYLGGHCEITNTRNQRQIQSEDFFLEITMHLGRKIDETEIQSEDLFSSLENIFPLCIFDCGCMPPLSKIFGTPPVAYAESFRGEAKVSSSCVVTNQLGKCRRHDHYRVVRGMPRKNFAKLNFGKISGACPGKILQN